MDDKLDALLARIKELEEEVLVEIRAGEKKFGYEIRQNKVHFQEAVSHQHRRIKKSLGRYLHEAKILTILTAPVIWFCVVPMLFTHLVAEIYQFICFPIYGIPKVRRADYIVMDRRRLQYLNSMERFNCWYCEYVNGLLAYVQEIAGRTEQYWCPIKHALHLKTRHSRYHHFIDYGDAEQYRQRIEQVRRDFSDLKKEAKTATAGRAP
jgi:hypothetical protein